jgi:hypothetical protein
MFEHAVCIERDKFPICFLSKSCLRWQPMCNLPDSHSSRTPAQTVIPCGWLICDLGPPTGV